MRLTKRNPYLAGVILVIAVLALTAAAVSINLSAGLPFNLSAGFPPSHDYVLSATFTDANGVSPGANVVIAGAQVGQVTGVRISHGRAVVSMRIQRRFGPLHRGTVAAIRYSTLLAQKYVELTPAAGTPPLPSGAIIPSNETITPVDFDQVLSALDARTRQQVQVLVNQLGGGVAGEQAAINALADNLSTLSEISPPTLDTLRARDPQLASILTNLASVSATLAASHRQLGGLVQHTATVTGTLARNDASLDGLLTHLATVSQDTARTLRGNQANLHQTIIRLDPFLARITPQISTAAGYLSQAAPVLRDEMTYLIPEVVSAIAQRDAGGNYLRQYVVVNTCYDLLSKTPSNGRNCLAQLAGPPALGQAPPAARKGRARCPSPAPSPAATPGTAAPSPSPLLPFPSPPSAAGCTGSRQSTRAPSPSPSPSGVLGSIFSFFGGGS
jgi:virulence factor Mce-like protein